MKAFNVRLTEEVWTDLLTMAQYAGKPNNLAAGFYALVAEWHRLKAADAARLEWQRLKADGGARLARHEEYLDAQDRHEEATA